MPPTPSLSSPTRPHLPGHSNERPSTPSVVSDPSPSTAAPLTSMSTSEAPCRESRSPQQTSPNMQTSDLTAPVDDTLRPELPSDGQPTMDDFANTNEVAGAFNYCPITPARFWLARMEFEPVSEVPKKSAVDARATPALVQFHRTPITDMQLSSETASKTLLAESNPVISPQLEKHEEGSSEEQMAYLCRLPLLSQAQEGKLWRRIDLRLLPMLT
ncbi:hypothetical protein BU15DRAFT_76261 [Melanogaster broomeanus]|nr:hypothetical protein BU15DRAFT_76261 [Melanogaster broomeanus]